MIGRVGALRVTTLKPARVNALVVPGKMFLVAPSASVSIG